MAPRAQTPPTHDDYSMVIHPKKSDKVHVVVKGKKQRSEGVIDFGFVKDKKNGGVTFIAGKMKKDFKFIEQEIIVKSMYEPLRDSVLNILVGFKQKRQRSTRTKKRWGKGQRCLDTDCTCFSLPLMFRRLLHSSSHTLSTYIQGKQGVQVVHSFVQRNVPVGQKKKKMNTGGKFGIIKGAWISCTPVKFMLGMSNEPIWFMSVDW